MNKEKQTDGIIVTVLVGITIMFSTFMSFLYYYNTWDNGVLEGRCIERGGTIHNVDGSLKCVINGNLE